MGSLGCGMVLLYNIDDDLLHLALNTCKRFFNLPQMCRGIIPARHSHFFFFFFPALNDLATNVETLC